MSIASLDDLIAALAAQQVKPFYFPSVTSVAGRLTNLNAAGVGRYGQMATPAVRGSGGTLHVDSDAGFPFFDNATGGADLYLLGLTPGMQTAGGISIYERIWSCSGMSGTTTTAQTVTGFPTLTIPDVNGTGLEMFAEIYTQIGVTVVNVTVSYTNSAGTSGRTSVAQQIGGTALREVQRLIPLPLQGNDTGVKSIASATLSGAGTGTAGDWGITLARKLCTYSSTSNFGGESMDFADLGMPKVDPDAALMFVLSASSTTSGLIDGTLVLGQK